MTKVRGYVDTKEAYDALAFQYDRQYDSRIHRAEDAVVIGWLRKHFGPIRARGNIADLGCGTGFLLDHMPEIRHYFGIDISAKMLQQAADKHQKPGQRFDLGTMEKLPYADRTMMGVVSLFGSFSYAENPMAVASEIRRVLHPNGKAFIMAYGKRYDRKKSYILNRYGVKVTHNLYDIESLKLIFSKFLNVKIYGLNAVAESLRFMPQGFLEMVLKAERRVMREESYFLIVEAER